jgi:hypothetical protein
MLNSLSVVWMSWIPWAVNDSSSSMIDATVRRDTLEPLASGSTQ